MSKFLMFWISPSDGEVMEDEMTTSNYKGDKVDWALQKFRLYCQNQMPSYTEAMRGQISANFNGVPIVVTKEDVEKEDLKSNPKWKPTSPGRKNLKKVQIGVGDASALYDSLSKSARLLNAVQRKGKGKPASCMEEATDRIMQSILTQTVNELSDLKIQKEIAEIQKAKEEAKKVPPTT